MALATTMALGTQAEAQERMEWVRDLNSGGDMVPVRVVGNTAMIDDMILGSWQQIDTYGLADWQPSRLKSPVAIKGGNRPARLWHGVDVPFDFDASYTAEGRAIVRQAMALYQLQSGIRFTPRTKQTDYILFTRSNHECTSNLGKVGKAQAISMNESCMVSLTDTLHFMGHSLGLGHVHQREPAHLNSIPGFPERGSMSSSLAIGWQSHRATLARDQQSNPATFYDQTSVMHYDPHWREGLDLTPASFTPHFHPRQLSESDIRELAARYPGAVRYAKEQDIPRERQSGRLHAPGTGQCLGYSTAEAVSVNEPASMMQLVKCTSPTARWQWDQHQRLQSGHQATLCLDLGNTRTPAPRMAPCNTSNSQIWQYRNHKLYRQDLGLMRDVNDNIVVHKQTETQISQVPATLAQLWQWVPDSQP